MSLMTSYNLANGIHTANNGDLLTKIAREEWGFKGIVVTDWGTTGGVEAPSEWKYGNSSVAGCIRAGNDLIMPGKQEDVDDTVNEVGAEEGTVPFTLTREELQACAMRTLETIFKVMFMKSNDGGYKNSGIKGLRIKFDTPSACCGVFN